MANEVYQLVVRKGPRPGQVFPLELDVLTIGRDPISDIVIEDPEISRHHAKLTQTPDGYELQDMGSTNGSFVDGQRLSGAPVPLSPGQVIMLGSNVTLVFNAPPASDPLATVVAPAAKPVVSPPSPEPPEEPAAEEPEIEELASSPADEMAVEEREPESVEPVVAAPIVTEPLEPEEEMPKVEDVEVPAPVDDEDDAVRTMLEHRPVIVEEPEPEPLPTFDEIEPEPKAEEPPELEPPTPFPTFEKAEPEPPPAIKEVPPAPEVFDETIVDSGEPLPEFGTQSVEEPPPIKPAGVVEDTKGDNRNRNIIIAVIVVLLLCCCCLLILGVLFNATDGFQGITVPGLASLAMKAVLGAL